MAEMYNFLQISEKDKRPLVTVFHRLHILLTAMTDFSFFMDFFYL